MSLSLDNVSDLKTTGNLVLKLLMSLRVSQKYGILQLSYQTTRYFYPTSQVGIQCRLSDWAQVQGSSVVKREQHEYDVKKKNQKSKS